MTDPILLFLTIAIVLAISVNRGAAGMIKLAEEKDWAGWKRSEFAWKLVISLVVIPVITIIWSV